MGAKRVKEREPIRWLIVILSFAALSGSTATTSWAASTPLVLRVVHHWRDATWTGQDLIAVRRSPYLWVADRHSTSMGERWHLAVVWYRRSRGVSAWVAHLRHPTRAECYALAVRRFTPIGRAAVQLELRILRRESGCVWWARNPYSTAAGPEQFLDTWGPLTSRMDVVWSINRAYQAVRTSGWGPWKPLP